MKVGDVIPAHRNATSEVVDWAIDTIGVVGVNRVPVTSWTENQLTLFDSTYMRVAIVEFPEDAMFIWMEQPCQAS